MSFIESADLNLENIVDFKGVVMCQQIVGLLTMESIHDTFDYIKVT